MKVLWLVPAALAIDQISKQIVMHSMILHESIPVLGEFFRLTYIHNAGAAFGLNLGSPLLHTLISIVALGALIWLFWTAPRDNRIMRFSISLILGGALGNIVDRIHLHEVVDFFDFGIGGLRWPVFNFADSFVTVGIFLLIYAYSRQEQAEAADADPETASPEERIAQG
jgi:signal peptidase II